MVFECMLAKSWDDSIDPTGWWMSEKLDGVRAKWMGNTFLSRNNKPFHAPDYFTKDLPPIALDGELYLGRGRFEENVSIVRSQDDKGWEKLVFHVFDAPELKGSFEERMQSIQDQYPHLAKSKYITLVPQEMCDGREHLERRLQEVIGKKRKRGTEPGEGIMLRRAGSPYEQKRSQHLLKVKRMHDDEAVVIAHLRGTGRNAHRLGALKVRWNDKEFKVGSGFTDAERNRPPKIGSIITFQYQQQTKNGVPRFPTFVRIREPVE